MLVVVCLLTARSPVQAQDDTTRFRWSIAGGRSIAIPSGRELRSVPAGVCFSCQATDQLVTGAADGQFHVAFNISNDLGKYVAFRMEGTFNRSTTDAQVLPPPTCVGLRCEQKRKASRDHAYLLGAGLEAISPAWRNFSAFAMITGGITLNKIAWYTDSVTKQEDKAIAFGPYYAPGVGVRYQVKPKLALYAQWRRAQTFIIPGSSMTSVSVGLLYSASLANYGY
jgi:hypothetical protein